MSEIHLRVDTAETLSVRLFYININFCSEIVASQLMRQ